MNRRLPLWRLALAILILGGMAAVLLSLAPFYVKDWQLRNYMRTLLSGPRIASLSDLSLARDVTGRAGELGLPVTASDVQIGRDGGRIRMDIRYTVHFDLYQVDLHFHSNAASR